MLPEAAAYPGAPPLRIRAEPGHLARGRSRLARMLSSILLGSIILVVLAVVVGMVLGAWRFTVIDTGSMRPTLKPGDVAVLTSESTADLKRGQIVAFHPPKEPNVTVMHRVVSIERTNSISIIQTKGDANNANDQWRAHILGDTVWQETLKIPMVGYLAAWSQQRPIRLGVLLIAVGLTVSLLLSWIWRPPNARARRAPAA